MRLALDVTVSNAARAALKAAGHEIVARALEGEPDSEWLARAWQRGAEAVVSEDKEVQMAARWRGVVTIIPVGRGSEQVESILNALNEVA